MINMGSQHWSYDQQQSHVVRAFAGLDVELSKTSICVKLEVKIMMMMMMMRGKISLTAYRSPQSSLHIG